MRGGCYGGKMGDTGEVRKSYLRKHYVKSVRETAQAGKRENVTKYYKRLHLEKVYSFRERIFFGSKRLISPWPRVRPEGRWQTRGHAL